MIKPYYEEPNIKIYCGDCLEVMKEFPDKYFDCVITSPPYNMRLHIRDGGYIDRREFGGHFSININIFKTVCQWINIINFILIA